MSKRPWALIAAAFALPLAFAFITNHAWEDYFITLRASRNLVEGNGLVFNPGERLHTFTSPLGVLIPALCTWIAGPGHEQVSLWLFRLINASLFAFTVGLAWRRMDALNIGAVGRTLFFGLLLLDPKLLDFSTNGMETAILLYFVLQLWSELESPAPRMPMLAFCVAGLMWTRPDSFILGGILILPNLIIRDRVAGLRTSIPWRPLITGVIVGGALYAPWFIWAWWYYGTPVPHTIIAKSQVTAPIHLRDMLLLPWRTLTGQSLLSDLFLPTYWFYGGWPAGIKAFGHILSGIAAFSWLAPSFPGVVRRLSLGVFLGMFYVCVIILFPWYSPPWMALCALTVALLIDYFVKQAVAIRRPQLVAVVRVAAVLAVAVQLSLLAATMWEMRTQQRIIEGQVRQPIGQWLHDAAKPKETVLLEPLGYVGYYSQLKTYDFPGLSSPEVVAAVKSGAHRYVHLIERLHPTWLVLRPSEVADPTKPENAVFNEYTLVRTWNVKPQLDAVSFLPGRAWLEHDSEFRVYRRKEPSGTVSLRGH